jgi:hypothetical protein
VKGLSLRNAARIWGTFVRHGVSLVRTLRSTCKGIMTARGVCQRFIILFAILGRNNVVDEEDPRSTVGDRTMFAKRQELSAGVNHRTTFIAGQSNREK